MKKGYLNALKLYGFFIILLHAQQQISAQVPDYFFHRLTTAEGLSQASNAYVYRDSRGFIWVSSIDGLNRYDGFDVKVYRPLRNDPYSMKGQLVTSSFFEVANGDFWFSTYEAINFYERKKNKFNSWPIVDPETKDTLREDYYVFYMDGQDRLWVRIGDNQAGQLYIFDTSTKKPLKVGPLWGNRCFVDTLSTQDSKTIYSFFYSREAPLYQTEIKEDRIAKNNALFNGNPYPKQAFYDLFISQDTLWLAGRFGLSTFFPDRNDWQKYRIEEALPVISIEPLRNNLLALSTYGEGLLFFDYSTQVVNRKFLHRPGRPSSITSNYLHDIYLDPMRTLWVSDWKAGLNYVHLDKPKVKVISLSDDFGPLKSSSIKSMAEDKEGNVWCATSQRGIIIFDNEGGHHQYYGKAGLPKTSVNYLYCTPGGVMFAVSEEGIYWYKEQSDQFIMVQGSDNIGIWGSQIIRQTLDGKLLFHNFETYEIKQGNGYSIVPSPLFPELDSVFIGYWYQDKNGVFYFNSNDASTIMIQPSGKVDTLEGINNLKACWEPSQGDTIWMATTFGLVKISKSTFRYKLYDESTGLPNQYIYSVLPGNMDELWLSSNKGVIKFNPITETAQRLTAADGVWDNEFNTNAWIKTSTGDIWLGNQDALNVIPKDLATKVKDFPKIQITRLLVNDKEWKDSLYIGEIKRLEFPFPENTISFEFVALEYSDPKNNQLWYHLDGYDPDTLWLESRKGVPGFARYSKLPPGNYTFQIIAANSDGEKTPSPHELKIAIRKPFYQEWWFIILVAALSASVVYGIYQYRLTQLRKELLLKQKTIESEMKALRAQMNPHFIFNCINSINAFILKNNVALASEYLNNFAKLIRQILDISSKEAIPLEEEIEFIESYLKAEKLRLKEKLQWKITVDDSIDTFETPFPSMVLQPFVENAIWHGIFPKETTGFIQVQISRENNSLVCIVEDNGIGRKASLERRKKLLIAHKSKGEANTRERLALYDQKNGTLSSWDFVDLHDKSGQPSGSRIILKIGLNK